MPRDDQQRIDDILLHPGKAIAKTREIDFDRFMAAENLHLAVTLHVQIIGEAAARLTQPYRARHEALPWKQIIAMRNLLVNDYGGVDYRIVWQVAREDLPQLAGELEKLK